MLISNVLEAKGRSVATILPDDTVENAVHRLAELRIGAVVVEDQWQKLVGIFSERDLVNLLAQHGPAALGQPVRSVMTSPVVTCRRTDRIDAVMGVMTARKIRHVPVVEGQALVGIVSIGDLVKHRLDEKELEAGVLLDLTRMRG
ncbi:MAG: CBS domain-containing protein [Acidisphaera sp.]|nr:CBS domain-containing protein [Acidisphaera sp.]